MESKKSIKEWAIDDRPREKLLLKGRKSLSDAELLAIIIGSGTPKLSALEIAKLILDSVNNNWNSLNQLTISDLLKFSGIGEARAISILASMEITKRHQLQSPNLLPKIKSSRDAYNLLSPLMADLPHEEFWFLCLNNDQKVLSKEQASTGGITQTIVDIRLMFKKVIELRATQLIIAHNHPSGSLQPSDSDKKLTKKIKEAGITLDIQLLDHLIISSSDYYSFADHELI